MTLRKTFEGDFKKVELTWGTAREKQKVEFYREKGVAALSSMETKKKNGPIDSKLGMIIYDTVRNNVENVETLQS